MRDTGLEQHYESSYEQGTCDPTLLPLSDQSYLNFVGDHFYFDYNEATATQMIAYFKVYYPYNDLVYYYDNLSGRLA